MGLWQMVFDQTGLIIILYLFTIGNNKNYADLWNEQILFRCSIFVKFHRVTKELTNNSWIFWLVLIRTTNNEKSRSSNKGQLLGKQKLYRVLKAENVSSQINFPIVLSPQTLN